VNLRNMTIGGVFLLAMGAPHLPLAADAPGTVANPLRAPYRSPLFGNSADRVPAPAATAAASPAAVSVASRTPPGMWRNPGWIQPPEASAETGSETVSHSPSMPPMAGASVAAPPSRTLVQRMRDRRIVQLEKQAQRLRELSLQEGQPLLDARGTPYFFGPENTDLQIDLGVPHDGPRAARAERRPFEDSTPGADAPLIESPQDSESLAGMLPPELNPPAAPPVDVQIELPDDPVPASPRPPLQARLRNWWSPTVR